MSLLSPPRGSRPQSPSPSLEINLKQKNEKEKPTSHVIQSNARRLSGSCQYQTQVEDLDETEDDIYSYNDTLTKTVTFDPFTNKYNSQSMTNLFDDQATPRTRYNQLSRAVSMQFLRNDNGQTTNLSTVVSIPKSRKSKNIHLQKTYNLNPSAQNSSLSVHAQLQNEAISEWYGLISPRPIEQSLDEILGQPGRTQQLMGDTATMSNAKSGASVLSSGQNQFQQLTAFANTQHDKISSNFRQIGRIFDNVKYRHERELSELTASELANHPSNLIHNSKPSSNIKRSKSVKQLSKNRTRVRSFDDTDSNTGKKLAPRDSVRHNVELKLEAFRHNPEARAQIAEIVEDIRLQRLYGKKAKKRNKKKSQTVDEILADNDFVAKNRVLIKSFSKKVLRDLSKQRNVKWEKRKDEIKLFKMHQMELMELRKKQLIIKMEDEKRKSLLPEMERKRQKIINQIILQQIRQKFWFSIIFAYDRYMQFHQLYERIDVLKEHRRQQNHAAMLMTWFYKKYVIARRRHRSKELVKVLQRTFRVAAVKYRFERCTHSADMILSFLYHFQRMQGLVKCLEKLDIDGRARLIQHFWRVRAIRNHCQCNLIIKQFRKFEQKYIKERNSETNNPHDDHGSHGTHAHTTHGIETEHSMAQHRRKTLKNTPLTPLPHEYLETKIQNHLLERRRKHKDILYKYFQLLEDFKKQHAKELEVIKAKKQLGIEAKLEYAPPPKPYFKIMMQPKEMEKFVKKLRSDYVVKKADEEIEHIHSSN